MHVCLQNASDRTDWRNMNEYNDSNNNNNIENITGKQEFSAPGNTPSNPEEDRYSRYITPGSEPASDSAEASARPSASIVPPAPPQGYYVYYSQAPAQFYTAPQPSEVKKKRHMPKFLQVILCALLFSVVAGGVFFGAYYVYNQFSGDTEASNSVISIGSSSRETNRHDTPVSIASTPIITDVDTDITDVSEVVNKAMPSIVSINCTFRVNSFFGTYESAGAGSGIVLRKTEDELLIATNNHVVDSALTIKVTFSDGTEQEAVCKGTDSLADLAVIAIKLTDMSESTLNAISVASLGDSNSIKVGQMAVAIGNAMGYGQSTTVGYISATDREVTVDGKIMTLLQTDAAINPGNSGGALLNLQGEVIGINSVKYASSDVEGMGFAIPISRAIDILDELASLEVLTDAEKGYLGIYMSTISAETAAAYNWPAGVYVSSVIEGCSAEAAGILKGDVITAINGVTVATKEDLRAAVTSHRAGTEITLTIQRLIEGEYTEMTLTVLLGANPEAGTNP